MKILYIVLLLNGTLFSMTRSARPLLTRPAHHYSTFQIKVTNPKLIASLEAARKNMQPAPAAPAKRVPEIIVRTTSRHQREHVKTRTLPAHAPAAVVRVADIPDRFPTRSEILADFSASAVEGYLEYKLYKKIDETLFSHSSHERAGQHIVESNSHSSSHNDDDDED